MKVFRKILGILVMIAGILGLILSLTGMVSIWLVKPQLSAGIESALTTVYSSIETSKLVMDVTEEALGATVNSVDALQAMLVATAASVKDTKPVFTQLNSFLGEKLPGTLTAATDSLSSAQKGAEVLDSAIRSLNTFRAVISSVPLIGGFVEAPTETYNPDKPLAESLGEVAANLKDLPSMFSEMAANLDKADNNLDTVEGSLTTMATNVSGISSGLAQYKGMVAQSRASMDNLQALLTNIQDNLNQILTIAVVVLSIFFLWLLAAQVVILSQGWELFQGTADRMEE